MGFIKFLRVWAVGLNFLGLWGVPYRITLIFRLVYHFSKFVYDFEHFFFNVYNFKIFQSLNSNSNVQISLRPQNLTKPEINLVTAGNYSTQMYSSKIQVADHQPAQSPLHEENQWKQALLQFYDDQTNKLHVGNNHKLLSTFLSSDAIPEEPWPDFTKPFSNRNDKNRLQTVKPSMITSTINSGLSIPEERQYRQAP